MATLSKRDSVNAQSSFKILHCDPKNGVLEIEAEEVAFITDFKILVENHYQDLKVENDRKIETWE